MRGFKKRFSACLAFLFTFLTILSAQDRGLEIVAKELGGQYAKIGKQYAVFIAIDSYSEWLPLKNPVKDAKEIRDILTGRYYIDQVLELYDKDATKAGVLRLFDSLIKSLKPEDSLFIYYAGHGQLDSTETGFWIPVDAGADAFEQRNWIPNIQVRNNIGKMQARHVALVSDSCFSGDILNPTRGEKPAIDQEYFRKAYSGIARQVLTSGASETVPDKSEFSRQLKLALKGNLNPYLDPLMLFSEIRKGVGATMPLFGDLKDSGHQAGGSFLFFLKNAALSETKPEPGKKPEPEPPSTGSVLVSSSRAGTVYIDGVEKGRLKADGSRTFPEIENGRTEVKIVYEDATSEVLSVRVEVGGTVKAAFTKLEPPAKQYDSLVSENMVQVKGGTFTMGSPSSEASRGSDEIQHEVRVSDFLIGKYEVTQKEWTEVMGSNPSYFKGDTLPVEQVSWYDVVEYCNKRSIKEGLTPCYTIDKSRQDPNNKNTSDTVKWVVTCDFSKNGYRLPTEAEWEYACRAGTTTPFSFGSSLSASQANFDGNNPYGGAQKGRYLQKIQSVGSYAANQYGIYDMHGNVWEWCWDWYGNYETASKADPKGAASGAYRVLRGGSWGNNGFDLRSATRGVSHADYRGFSYGVRVVRSLASG